jgi:DNA-3-methyladenine glycosylase
VSISFIGDPIFMRRFGRSFFRKDAAAMAEALIGKVLVHRISEREYRARIVETEAYLGPQDLASHSSKGRTRRTEVMFGPAGRAYVHFIYGMYWMLNIVSGKTGEAHAVLIRAAEPLDGWEANLSGPARLARALHITRADNGLDLTGDKLFLLDNLSDRPRVLRDKRVGVDYSGHWKDELLRFFDADSSAVSRPLPAALRRRPLRGIAG